MAILLFILAAVIIALAGTWLAGVADRLADRTGFGEALIGGVVLGASTSIPGITLSVTAAYDGYTGLAISNALGGIAMQTFFLCIADFLYRKSNLEHAAASSTNIILLSLLISLLSLPLLASALGDITLLGVHPISIVMIFSYLGGIKYASLEKKEVMWLPRSTKETAEDIPEEPQGGSRILFWLWLKFGALIIIMIISGVVVKNSGLDIAHEWGLSETALGSLFTSLTTSLPELITTLAAVRRGAITLAVGNIVGGNTFDVLFLAFSDISFNSGSIYNEMNNAHLAFIGLNIVMSAILLMGLIRREKHGIANVGTESILLTVVFILGYIFILS